MSDLEMEEHVPPPPEDPPAEPLAEQPQIVHCKCCEKQWDLTKDEHRVKVLFVRMGDDQNLYCCEHVPISSAVDVITSLTKQRYEWEEQARRELAKTEALEFEIRANSKISKAKLKAAFKQVQQLQEKVKQLEVQIEKLKKENEDTFLARRRLTQALIKIRNGLQTSMKRVQRIGQPVRRKLNSLFWECCKLLSKSKSTLHKQAVQGLRDVGFSGVFQPASLTETAHVHPISLNEDKHERESVVFCTVCGGLDAADSDELEEHSPKLATIVLPANAPANAKARAEALAALATPYHKQPIAWQTNGLALGN